MFLVAKSPLSLEFEPHPLQRFSWVFSSAGSHRELLARLVLKTLES